jgi:GNAT superfamily N-acetyltransferase
VTIVAFEPCHYPALARVLSEAYGDYVFDPDSLQAQDASLGATCALRRWMGMCNDRAVAVGEYRQAPEMYHPRKFMLNVAVHPDYQKQGLGARLYDRVTAELTVHRPISIRASARADRTRSVAFLERRGFVCDRRILECHLDLETFDVERFRGYFERARGTGIEVVPIEELGEDPDRNWKLYRLISAIREDVSLPESPTHAGFQQFVESFLENPSRLPDAAFVAVCNGEYIGYSDLRDGGAGSLYCELTGVLRERRRQRVATALKLHGVRYGRLQGYRKIKTFNAADNSAIRALNASLGFVEQFAWMHFEKACCPSDNL